MAVEPVLTGPKGTPEFSLGRGVYRWCAQYIRQPDGPDAGGPWKFTPEQARFLAWWYAVDDRGRWLYPRGVLRRMKGWGKSPFVAALALAELCGPVRFDRFKGGEPVGKQVSAAWVQLTGVSEKQTDNTMSMVLAMCAESPIVDDYGLDLGLTRIYTENGGKLEPRTASMATNEGARPTFVVEDETHHWTDSNNGTDLDRVNRRNLGKSRDGAARMLETTNAFAAGENSVAERSYQAWQAGGKLLYDSREAPATTDIYDPESLQGGIVAARGDSVWLDLERVYDECMDPATPPEDTRRFYLNQIANAVDAWLTEPEWAGCYAEKTVYDGDRITLGFDGSRKRARGITDATALIGCRVSDGHLFEIAVWEQPDHEPDWQVPALQVDAAVQMAHERWTVVGFHADPAKWESYVAQWEARYAQNYQVRVSREHPIEWWFTGGRVHRIVQATEQFHNAVLERELSHDGSFALTRHVLNARRRVGPAGVQIAKEHPESARKIDAAIAGVLAYAARLQVVARGDEHGPMFVPRKVR